MKTNAADNFEDVDKKITENKRKIKTLSDVNGLLVTRKSLQNKIKSLTKETEDLEKELHETQKRINIAWGEKIQIERGKGEKFEKVLKTLQAQLEANSDTPGYQQAIKHTEIQQGHHTKHDGPSTRCRIYRTTLNRATFVHHLNFFINQSQVYSNLTEEDGWDIRASVKNLVFSTNYKNMASRLQNEIRSLQQMVNSSKLTLINEIKQKTALEEEVRELRNNMSHRRSITPSKFISSSIPDLNLHNSARVN